MEDTLVSFETAKLAKEKGFKEESVKVAYNLETRSLVLLFNETQFVRAPTQSLLQKWLREQGWHIVINYDEKWYYTTFHIAVPYDESPYSYSKEDTYESCLEEALVFLLNQL